MSMIGIKQPGETWVRLERLGRGEHGGPRARPETPFRLEGFYAGRRRETGAAERDDAVRGSQLGVEFGDRGASWF